MGAWAACGIDTRILNSFSSISHIRMGLELNSLPLFFSRFQVAITKMKEQNSPSPRTSIVMLVLFSGSTAFLPSPSLPEPREDDVFKELIFRYDSITVPDRLLSLFFHKTYSLSLRADSIRLSFAPLTIANTLNSDCEFCDGFYTTFSREMLMR